METTKKTNENGVTTQTNFMFDDVIETYNNHWNQKDELIKKLTIQKIEYGRTCITQFFAQAGQTHQTAKSYYEKMDAELQNKIIEVGGEPTKKLIY